jgi:hypothetical protein
VRVDRRYETPKLTGKPVAGGTKLWRWPVAAHSGEGRRVALATKEPAFVASFIEAKRRVRQMHVPYVEEPEPLRQALLEIYASIVLATPYNDFELDGLLHYADRREWPCPSRQARC